MTRRAWTLPALVLVLSTMLAAPVFGQGRGRSIRQQIERSQILHTTGKIEQVKPGLLAVTAVDASQWWVQVDPRKTRIACTGEAEPGVLQAGMAVRFSGEFDADGKAQKPIEQLTVFTPSRDTRPGVYPDNGPDVEAGEGLADEPAPDAPKPTRRDRAAKPEKELESGRFFVVGTIRGVEDKTLEVALPGQKISVEIAPSARIDVETADYRFAQPGDQVEFRAQIVDQAEVGKPGQLAASELKIEFSKPISLPEDPKQQKKKRRGRERDDEEGDDKVAGAAN